MIITNGSRDLKGQLSQIYNDDMSVISPCECCEFGEMCPNNHENHTNLSIPPYAMKEFDSCYITDNTALVECGKKNVSEGIGESYKISNPNTFIKSNPYDDSKEINEDCWEPAQPVFISAQTGQGKNYFVENTLPLYLRELNDNFKLDFKILVTIQNRLSKN